MSKLSAYQKLKAENLKLKQDLMTLATEPKSSKGLSIRTKWTMQKAMENSYWAGSVTADWPENFDGVINRIIVREEKKVDIIPPFFTNG